MLDLLALIRDVLIKWNQETYILLRIRFIMVLLLILYIVMFSLVFVIRLIPRSIAALNLLDAVCDSILAYILGAMQAAPFKNKLFPVWALVLVSFRSSVNGLSRYGTYTELRNVLKLLAVAYMNITQGSKIWRFPFWIFWSLLVLRSVNRIYARRVASKSLWLGRSSELLQDYMSSNLSPDSCDPETMIGYRYLVYGEAKQSRETGLTLCISDSMSPITLDKIWRCPLPLLRSSSPGRKVKELSLAFALSRLLRCKLEGATLDVASVTVTRKLICSRILTSDDGAEKAFGILELDLVFLNEYLHTSYPMIFSEGFSSLAFTFLQSLVRYIMITWIGMCFIMIMDVWEMSFNAKEWVASNKVDGAKLSAAIMVPRSVKIQVVGVLSSLCDMKSDVYSLPKHFTPLRSRYWLACLELPICSHVILVLHIATSICEMKLAQDRGMDLRKPGFLCSTFQTWLCSSSQPYLVDVRSLGGDLRTNYGVANSLSRYCTYLLVCKPDLLPDTVLLTKKVFRETLWHAREMLKDCSSLQSIYSKLIPVSREAVEPSSQGSITLSGNIVQQGVQLGKELIYNEKKEELWRILAEVWVNLLVHIAPSSNAEAHAKYLESGGEFISLIWALFYHCGIKKSELWQENATSWNNSPQSSQQNNGVAPPQVQQTVASAQPAAQPDYHASDLDGGEGIEEVMETSPTPTGIS
ncbi:unnamed protein product [Urochloa decumbens]|uniref:DUF4220 domain-containing protein n=1 Tax=Urochloa decumbens TaxID=240449 RepID=A0ABC9B0B8_9POAL